MRVTQIASVEILSPRIDNGKGGVREMTTDEKWAYDQQMKRANENKHDYKDGELAGCKVEESQTTTDQV